MGVPFILPGLLEPTYAAQEQTQTAGETEAMRVEGVFCTQILWYSVQERLDPGWKGVVVLVVGLLIISWLGWFPSI